MHAGQLVQLAALVADSGPSLVRGSAELPERAFQDYWTTSTCRANRWAHLLNTRATTSAGPSTAPGTVDWRVCRPIAEEILAGEVLARVWAGVASAYDKMHGTDHIDPIVRRVIATHGESRHRVLGLMALESDDSSSVVAGLNRVRRHCERLTDMLLAYVINVDDVGEFAADADRAREFSRDLREEYRAGRSANLIWSLTVSSIRSISATMDSSGSPCRELNRRVAASILACFRSERFESVGLLGSLWKIRLANITNETENMIREFMCSDTEIAREDDYDS